MAVKLEAPKPTAGRGGGKLSRSETVTVRLDPKLRYLAELAARKQRRTLSSFIEWAIEDTLARLPIKEGDNWQTMLLSQSEVLWDVDDADRFAKLAFNYPELLTHEEQILWKLVRENSYVWRGRYTDYSSKWSWTVKEESLNFNRLRELWPLFNEVAAGEKPASALPEVMDRQPAKPPSIKPPASKSGFEDMDDDIPF
jgi:hypothetical protein